MFALVGRAPSVTTEFEAFLRSNCDTMLSAWRATAPISIASFWLSVSWHRPVEADDLACVARRRARHQDAFALHPHVVLELLGDILY